MKDPDLEKHLNRIYRELKEIKAAMVQVQESWLSEKEAAAFIGMTVEGIRKARYAGKIKNWRVRSSGRGVQYQKTELDQLFMGTSNNPCS